MEDDIEGIIRYISSNNNGNDYLSSLELSKILPFSRKTCYNMLIDLNKKQQKNDQTQSSEEDNNDNKNNLNDIQAVPLPSVYLSLKST